MLGSQITNEEKSRTQQSGEQSHICPYFLRVIPATDTQYGICFERFWQSSRIWQGNVSLCLWLGGQGATMGKLIPRAINDSLGIPCLQSRSLLLFQFLSDLHPGRNQSGRRSAEAKKTSKRTMRTHRTDLKSDCLARPSRVQAYGA